MAEFDEWILEQRLDCGFEVRLIGLIDLGGDTKRQVCARCDLNRLVHSFFG